jgi:peptidase E
MGIARQSGPQIAFSAHESAPAPDRRVRWRRLFDGGGQRTPARLRPRAHGRRASEVCFLPSASGDADHYIVRFYRAFSPARCQPSHISLFRRDTGAGFGGDVTEHLLAQDLIYVGGGSLISLMGVWRAHGLDEVLRECWLRGVVLCGLSAGSLCWFSEAVTAFHGPPQRVRGLGLLPYSNCVHYDGEPARRDSHRFLGEAWQPATPQATVRRCTPMANLWRASCHHVQARRPTGLRLWAARSRRWRSRSTGWAGHER